MSTPARRGAMIPRGIDGDDDAFAVAVSALAGAADGTAAVAGANGGATGGATEVGFVCGSGKVRGGAAGLGATTRRCVSGRARSTVGGGSSRTTSGGSGGSLRAPLQ